MTDPPFNSGVDTEEPKDIQKRISGKNKMKKKLQMGKKSGKVSKQNIEIKKRINRCHQCKKEKISNENGRKLSGGFLEEIINKDDEFQKSKKQNEMDLEFIEGNMRELEYERSQLRAEAEIFYGDSKVTNRTNIPKRILVNDNNLDGTDSEDNIPLMELRGRMKKRKIEVKKKSYKWVAKDLIPEEVQFPCQQNVLNNNSPSELFSFFWSDDVIEMFVTYSNLYATSKKQSW
ncbi:hypothetical protein JTB14_016511 [Gonioctena quinquepunctata]|nr:hypothetical protein JTB14_016511 [Gonioctena quinquepunctata]